MYVTFLSFVMCCLKICFRKLRYLLKCSPQFLNRQMIFKWGMFIWRIWCLLYKRIDKNILLYMLHWNIEYVLSKRKEKWNWTQEENCMFVPKRNSNIFLKKKIKKPITALTVSILRVHQSNRPGNLSVVHVTRCITYIIPREKGNYARLS